MQNPNNTRFAITLARSTKFQGNQREFVHFSAEFGQNKSPNGSERRYSTSGRSTFASSAAASATQSARLETRQLSRAALRPHMSSYRSALRSLPGVPEAEAHPDPHGTPTPVHISPQRLQLGRRNSGTHVSVTEHPETIRTKCR